MNILSIDTSGKSFSLTLVKDSIKTSFIDTSESVSSESVLVEIDKLVSKCKISPKELSNFVGCFLTGTAAAITPLQSIDEVKCKTGDGTKKFKFMQDYHNLVRS